MWISKEKLEKMIDTRCHAITFKERCNKITQSGIYITTQIGTVYLEDVINAILIYLGVNIEQAKTQIALTKKKTKK